MVWVRLDDHFDQNPKIAGAGPLGIALWVTGLAYCNRNLTNGFIPWATARSLLSWQYLSPPDEQGRRRVQRIGVTSGMVGEDAGSDMVIGLLLEAGLWEEVDGGYLVHDYDDYQPSREQVEAEREAGRERVRAHRNARKQQGNAVITPEVTGNVTPLHGEYFARSNGSVTPLPDPDPDTAASAAVCAAAAARDAADEPSEGPGSRLLRERVDALVMRLPPAQVARDEPEIRDHFRQLCEAYDERQVIEACRALRPSKPWPGALHSKLRELYPDVEAETRKPAADEWHPRIENWGDLPAVTP